MNLKVINLLLFFYFILPFVFTRNIYNGSIVPKSVILGIIFIITATYGLYRIAKTGILYYSKIYIFALLFLISGLFSIFINSYAVVGLFSFSRLLCFFSFIFFIQYIDFDKKTVFRLFGIQSLIIMIIMAFQALSGNAPTATLGNSGWASSVAILGFLCGFSTLQFSKKNERNLAIVSIIFAITWLYLCNSNRAVLLSLSIIIFLSIFNFLYFRKKILALFFMMIMGSMAFIFISSANKRISSIEYRKILWMTGLDNFKESPLFGKGPGTFPIIASYKQLKFGKYFNNFLYLKTNISHAHNEYIEILSDFGITGTILLLFMILFLLWSCRKDPSFYILIFILIYSFFWFPLRLPVQSLYIATICSFIIKKDINKIKYPLNNFFTVILSIIFSALYIYLFIFPIFSEYFYAKGELKKFSNDYKNAKKYYSKSMIFSPINARSLTGKAFCLNNESKYKKSNIVLEKALQIKPSRDIFYLLGMNYYFLKDYKNTYKYLKMAALLENKRDYMARLDFIKFALRFGYTSDASRFSSELKKLHPSVLKNLGVKIDK